MMFLSQKMLTTIFKSQLRCISIPDTGMWFNLLG